MCACWPIDDHGVDNNTQRSFQFVLSRYSATLPLFFFFCFSLFVYIHFGLWKILCVCARESVCCVFIPPKSFLAAAAFFFLVEFSRFLSSLPVQTRIKLWLFPWNAICVVDVTKRIRVPCLSFACSARTFSFVYLLLFFFYLLLACFFLLCSRRLFGFRYWWFNRHCVVKSAVFFLCCLVKKRTNEHSDWHLLSM